MAAAAAATSSDLFDSCISYSSDDSDYDTTEENEDDEVVAVYSYLDDLLQDTSREVGTSSEAIESNINTTAIKTSHQYLNTASKDSDSMVLRNLNTRQYHHDISGEADDDEIDDDEKVVEEEFEQMITNRNDSRHDGSVATTRDNTMTVQDSNRSMYSSILMSNNNSIGESCIHEQVGFPSSHHVNGSGAICCGLEEEKNYIEQDMKAIEYYLNQHHQMRQMQVAQRISTTTSTTCAVNAEIEGNLILSDCSYDQDDDNVNDDNDDNDVNDDNDDNDDNYNRSSSSSISSAAGTATASASANEDNQSSSSRTSNHFNSNPTTLKDHQLYYYTNSANPIAIKQTFLYCIQMDDVVLLKQLLRDIGIEYLLRHCVQYHGLLEENTHFLSSSPKSKSKSKLSSLPSKSKLGSEHLNATENIPERSSANIFWLAALHGSAKVLEILLRVTWIHFAEMYEMNQYQLDDNIEAKDDGVVNDTDNGTHDGNDNNGPKQEEEDSQANKEDNPEIIEQSSKNEIRKYLNESALSYGTSPMYVAAAQNHKDVILVLLKYGVDPNRATNESLGGTTPAIIAASRNHTDALKGLSKSDDIDFNKANHHKITPLLAACQNGCLGAVRFLTHFTISDDHGFDIPVVNTQCQNSIGYGCASIAAKHNQHEVIIYLSQMHDPQNTGIDVNQRSPEGDTVIHVATRYNRHSVVKALLEMIPRTCNITQINKYGMNALHLAASHGYTIIVKEFIQCLSIEEIRECDVEDLYGMTPIFYATLKGHYDIVSTLASVSNINALLRVQLTKKKNRRKGEKNEKNRKRKLFTHQTPLHVAAMHGFVNIVYTLLHCGADINKLDSGGHTALSLAAKMGNLEVVKILVEHGADVRIKSKRGKTPLAKAKRYKRHEIVEYLEQFYSK